MSKVKAALGISCAVALMALGTGCGGASAGPMASAAYVPQPSAAAGMDSASSTSTARSSEALADSAAPSERQGLGTQWGENRESWVHDTAFTRESDRALRVFAIRYNDRAGIQAMLGSNAGGWGEIAAPELSVELRGESGRNLPTARSGERFFVTGVAGERYSIVVRNHSGRRMEIVASVDGLDVLSGKEASTRSRGYVVAPYESLEIDGFRQSQGSVAAFRFSGVGESYAAATGTARNVGVIGVAAFPEREDRPSAQELRIRETASPFPASDPRYARPPR